jgi:acylphosphatase
MANPKRRWTVLFTGRVQGVGFRASTEHIAAGFAVTGYVRNLADGRVELVAEGTDSELAALVREITARLGQHIRQQTQTTDAASGEWEDFSVRC